MCFHLLSYAYLLIISLMVHFSFVTLIGSQFQAFGNYSMGCINGFCQISGNAKNLMLVKCDCSSKVSSVVILRLQTVYFYFSRSHHNKYLVEFRRRIAEREGFLFLN